MEDSIHHGNAITRDVCESAVFQGKSKNITNDKLTKQLRKTKNEILNLKELVKMDSRMAQIVLLFDEL